MTEIKVKPKKVKLELTLAELQVIRHALTVLYMANVETSGLFALHARIGEDDRTASRKVMKAIKTLEK
jgi:hypothetical protein